MDVYNLNKNLHRYLDIFRDLDNLHRDLDNLHRDLVPFRDLELTLSDLHLHGEQRPASYEDAGHAADNRRGTRRLWASEGCPQRPPGAATWLSCFMDHPAGGPLELASGEPIPQV